MHRTTVSTSTGGLLSRLSGSKTPTRPHTSSGTPSESATALRTSSFGRKASFSSTTSRRSHKSTSTSLHNQSPEKRIHTSTQHTDNTPLPVFTPAAFQEQDLHAKSAPDSATEVAASAEAAQTQTPASPESVTSTTPYANMLVRPSTGYQSLNSNGTSNFPPAVSSQPPASPSSEAITYQHIQETSSKRISTLDYLRKA